MTISSSTSSTGGDCEFSDILHYTGPSPVLDPRRKLVAVPEDHRLFVRDAESLMVVALFICPDAIEHIAWSSTGSHVMCVLYKHASVHAFSISDPEWHCNLTEGLAGIAAAYWCPDGVRLLTVAEFQVKMSVWSLVDRSCTHLVPPKHSQNGLSFSPDGSMLAVLERTNCKDALRIYETSSWKTISYVTSLGTDDAADLRWSPDSSCLAIWEASFKGPLVSVFTPSGERLVEFRTPESYGLGLKTIAWSPYGQLLLVGSYEGELALLNHVSWSPLAWLEHPSTVAGPSDVVVYMEERCQQASPTGVLSPGNKSFRGEGGDGRTNLMSRQTNRPGFLPGGASSNTRGSPSRPASSRNENPSKKSPKKENSQGKSQRDRRFTTPSPSKSSPNSKTGKLMGSPARHVSVLKEESSILFLNGAVEDGNIDLTSYSIAELPVKIPFTRAPVDRPNPKIGIGMAKWSCNGLYIAVRCDERPNVLWIWDVSTLSLASVLIHIDTVRSFDWDSSLKECPRLAVVCGSKRVYFWSPNGASSVQIPMQGMSALNVEWLKDGSGVALVGKDSTCFAYLHGAHALALG